MKNQCSEKKNVEELLKLQRKSEERWQCLGGLGKFAIWLGVACLIPFMLYWMGNGASETLTISGILVVCVLSSAFSSLMALAFTEALD